MIGEQIDDLDRIMAVMRSAFDPAYGEAWNRLQVSDALALPNTHYILAGADGEAPGEGEPAVGFALSRSVLEDEELLLLAVDPACRGRGIGTALLARFIRDAHDRGTTRLLLEMRDGNPAASLYRRAGFEPIGRRRNYYRGGSKGPLDAITYLRSETDGSILPE